MFYNLLTFGMALFERQLYDRMQSLPTKSYAPLGTSSIANIVVRRLIPDVLHGGSVLRCVRNCRLLT